MTGNVAGNYFRNFRYRISLRGGFHLSPHLRKVDNLGKVYEDISVPQRTVKRLHFVHPDVGMAKLVPRDVHSRT